MAKTLEDRLSRAEAMIREAGDDRDALEGGLDLLGKCAKEIPRGHEYEFDLHLLAGLGLTQLGDLPKALEEFDAALKLEPEDPEVRVERAITLLELCRFEDAKQAFEALAADEPEEAWPHHGLGLLAERNGRADAATHFARATALDPEQFPPVLRLSDQDFAKVVEKAIASLPEQSREPLQNALITVAAFPSDELLQGGEVSPMVLGLFVGTPIDERSPYEASHHQTAQIYVFKNNLERFCRSKEELHEQIGVTLLHEVGHLLGLDEDELYDRGLD